MTSVSTPPVLTIATKTRLLPSGRVAVIDELRGVAIVLIILFHLAGVIGFSTYINAEVGVDVFLLISGCLITSSALDSNLPAFFKKRFFRIFPAYWIALNLYVYLHYSLLGITATTTDYFIHLFAVHGLMHDHGLLFWNDSFWFLGLIVPLYILAYLIRGLSHRLDVMIGLMGILTFASYYRATLAGDSGILNLLTPRIPAFFVGMLVGRFLSAKELIIKPSIWGFIGGALLFYTFSQQQMLIGRLPSALAICFTWIALSGWLKRTEKGLILCRAISGLGAISYELFLFHQPLIREYNHWSWNYFYGVQNPTKSQLLLGAAIAIGGLLLIILLTKKVIGLIRTPPGLDPSTIQSPISSP